MNKISLEPWQEEVLKDESMKQETVREHISLKEQLYHFGVLPEELAQYARKKGE